MNVRTIVQKSIRETNYRDSYQIRDLVVERGLYRPKENLKVYYKGFTEVPSLRLRLPLKKYKLKERKVLDAGCSFGGNLFFFGEGSVGVDIVETQVSFGRSLGLDIRWGNIDDGDLHSTPDEEFDAIWCSNVLEHMVSPFRIFSIIRGSRQYGSETT